MSLVRTDAEYRLVLATLCAYSGAIAIDTETTGLHPYDGDVIRGISIATAEWDYYIPISHPDSVNFDPSLLMQALWKTGHTFIFHHGVFDYAFLAQVCTPEQIQFIIEQTERDTQVGNWLYDENLKTGLKESCERIFGHDAGDEKRALKQITKDTGRTWATFTAEDIGDYASLDARLTFDLWRWQRDFDISPVAMARELRVQRVIYEMNRTGIGVDRLKLVENRDRALARRR